MNRYVNNCGNRIRTGFIWYSLSGLGLLGTNDLYSILKHMAWPLMRYFW